MTIRLFRDGKINEYTVEKGISLTEFLKRENLGFSLPCGGHGRCQNCRVRATGELSELSFKEKEVLSHEEIGEGYRLACFTRIEGDCNIYADEETDRIADFFVSHGDKENVSDDRLVDSSDGFGAAFDIGTTTVCGYLYDLSSGECLSRTAAKNRQTIAGGDVISRIEYALSGKISDLQDLICSQIDEMTVIMCKNTGISPVKISKAVICGNTAMMYFLTGRNPVSIASAPFESETLFGEYYNDLNIPSLGSAEIYLPGCIGAYVGGDITCGILSSGIYSNRDNVLMCDIGTNGEIVLATQNGLISCSTAAGPAFEGAGLSCGMTAKDGAICHVRIEKGKPKAEVLGDKEPEGFCGSGIIDALAVMLSLGMVDQTGRINDGYLVKNPAGEDAVSMFGLFISQRDIRNIQSGKAAICAGIKTLLAKEDLRPEDLSKVIIAGGFGTYIDPESAEMIGLIPKGLCRKSVAVGNAAAMGAVMILLSEQNRSRSAEISLNAVAYDLSTDPDFTDRYIEEMFFPEDF